MKCNYKLGGIQNFSKVQDKSLCEICGGKCCKTSGCMYFPSDFPNLSFHNVCDALESGRVSLCTNFDMDFSKRNIKASPILYLKSREVGKGKIDLFSVPTQCASLESDGCFFNLDNRPSGGAIIVPKMSNGKFACEHPISKEKQIELWMPFTRNLKKVAEHYLDGSLEDAIKKDVEKWFYDVYTAEDDVVISYLKGQAYYLKQFYPDQYDGAMKRIVEETGNVGAFQFVRK